MYSIDLGLAHDVLKDNGTVNFTAKDLFNTRKRRNITDVNDFYSESEFQWRSRQFRLSFTYRINTKKNKKNRFDRDFDDEGM